MNVVKNLIRTEVLENFVIRKKKLNTGTGTNIKKKLSI